MLKPPFIVTVVGLHLRSHPYPYLSQPQLILSHLNVLFHTYQHRAECWRFQYMFFFAASHLSAITKIGRTPARLAFFPSCFKFDLTQRRVDFITAALRYQTFCPAQLPIQTRDQLTFILYNFVWSAFEFCFFGSGSHHGKSELLGAITANRAVGTHGKDHQSSLS